MKKELCKTMLICVLGLLCWTEISAQSIQNTAFQAGEKFQFIGYYNWGMIWVNAGTVDVAVTQTAEKSNYQIKGTGRNAKAFDMFFKLRDTLTTVIDKETLLPYSLLRLTNEGNYKARHHYTYNYANKKIKSAIQKQTKPQKNTEIAFEGCVNNLMSVLYYARNIDYDNLKKGTKIPIKLLVDGKISNVVIHYKGVEKVKIKRRKKFLCYKITPVLPEGSIFKEGDGMVVWLSKDKNRVPLMVEGKIPVGAVKGVLVGYSGLRHKDNILGNTKGELYK